MIQLVVNAHTMQIVALNPQIMKEITESPAGTLAPMILLMIPRGLGGWRSHTQCTLQARVRNNQQHNLERLRFNRRGASTALWGVESCSFPKQEAQPNPRYPALCRQDATSPWRKHLLLNPKTNAGSGMCLEKKKKNERNTFSRKTEK